MASVTSLDHDMRKLRLERYTPAAANEVKSWIEEALGEQLDGDLIPALKDGVALCKLVNLAKPPPSIRFKASNMPFTQRENISQFLNACEGPPFNMPSHDRFLTVDLYDEKDPAQVIQCLSAFSRAAHSLNPTRFPNVVGPKRGAASPTRNTAEGGSYPTVTPARPVRGFNGGTPASQGSATPASVTKSPRTTRMMSPISTGSRTPDSAMQSPASVSSWSKKKDVGATAPAWNIHQYGYMGGASQGNQGVVFGAPRQITSPAIHVPSVAEKQARIRQQELEAEKEAQRREEEAERDARRRREEEEQLARERQAQIEAEEEQARLEEQRLVEEETRKARQREEEDAERERLEMEAEREELRKAQQREREAVERDKEERRKYEMRRMNEEEQAQRDNESIRAPSTRTVTSTASQSSSESDRIRELERQLEEAKQRERRYMQQQQLQDSSASQHTAGQGYATISPDESFTAGEREELHVESTAHQPMLPSRSGGPRPLPNAPPKPAIAPKPRNTPFSRPIKPLEPPQAEPQPAAPPRATAEPPSGNSNLAPHSSSQPTHVTRTDEQLPPNPAPVVPASASSATNDVDKPSTSERNSKDGMRPMAPQKSKAGGWGGKSLLEREMERERERQREWEDTQIAKAKASGISGRGVMGPRAMNNK